jgi:hypothetical protein
MVLLGDGLKWKLISVCLEILVILMQDGCVVCPERKTVLVLEQDRCTLCTKCTIGSEIILDAPDGTPR